MNVKGEYVRHSERDGFVYQYWCVACGARMVETAPELTAPILCHGCYTGNQHEAIVRRGQYARRKKKAQ